MARLTIEARDIIATTTAHVAIRGARVAKFRVWLATKLFLVAARIGGFGCEVEVRR